MSVPLEPNTGRAGARSNNECRARDGYDCSRGRVLMNLLFLVFTFPLLGFLTLALSRTRISENAAAAIGVGSRSEEHTSELQSLMRISYAVFCLKKKKKHTNQMINMILSKNQ